MVITITQDAYFEFPLLASVAVSCWSSSVWHGASIEALMRKESYVKESRITAIVEELLPIVVSCHERTKLKSEQSP